MSQPTSNPVHAAHARLRSIAYDHNVPILDRLTCETAALYLEACYSYRVQPNAELLAAISSPLTTPIARAQEINKLLLKAMIDIGIPIPMPPSIMTLMDQEEDGRTMFPLPEPSPC